MYTLDTALVKQIMVGELGVSEIDATLFLESIDINIREPLDKAVEEFIKTRTISDIKINDLTISELMATQRIHFFDAVHWLNCMLRPGISQKDLDGFRKAARWVSPSSHHCFK